MHGANGTSGRWARAGRRAVAMASSSALSETDANYAHAGYDLVPQFVGRTLRECVVERRAGWEGRSQDPCAAELVILGRSRSR